MGRETREMKVCDNAHEFDVQMMDNGATDGLCRLIIEMIEHKKKTDPEFYRGMMAFRKEYEQMQTAKEVFA